MMWRKNNNCNRLQVKLLKDYQEMLQDPILEQEVCVEPTRTLFSSQIHLTTESVLKKDEQEKKRNYNRGIVNIEHGTFTQLFFSISGGMGKECSVFHKHVAE